MNPIKEMTRNQLETLRRVMVKRITQDLTAQKLSFLCGRPLDYIRNVELLINDPYSIADLKCIAIALDEKNFQSFFPNISDERVVSVNMVTKIVGTQYIYTCSIITADLQELKYFTLQEEVPDAVKIKENNEYDSIIAKDAIELLIRVGYFFKSRMPAKIYKEVTRFLHVKISPTYVQNALDSFCNMGEDAALVRSTEGGKGYRYVEV
jgi:hypothetical protein